tara:strand:+ start:372 stop:851 length:480 start_codon:yes stop_codon:yes gene_type:complete
MPELDGKKYSYDKKGMGQYKKDLAKKGYVPQTKRDMNAGYTPQTQMTDEQLAQKAYGPSGIPQIRKMQMAAMAGAQRGALGERAKHMKMMAVQKKAMMKQEAVNQKKASYMVNAVDSVMSENVQLKKQLNLNQVQLEKSKTINQARQKPVDITKKRTGK